MPFIILKMSRERLTTVTPLTRRGTGTGTDLPVQILRQLQAFRCGELFHQRFHHVAVTAWQQPKDPLHIARLLGWQRQYVSVETRLSASGRGAVWILWCLIRVEVLLLPFSWRRLASSPWPLHPLPAQPHPQALSMGTRYPSDLWPVRAVWQWPSD